MIKKFFPLILITLIFTLSACNETLLYSKRDNKSRVDNSSDIDNITDSDNSTDIETPKDNSTNIDNKTTDNSSPIDYTKDPNYGKFRRDGDVEVVRIVNSSAPIPELGGASYKYVITVIGDGFLREDNTVGGAFDLAVDRAVGALFSMEPFKTYSGNFLVYKVYADSIVRTTDNRTNNTKTVFGSQFNVSNNRLLLPTKSVANYVTKASSSRDMVLLLVNTTIYGGSGGSTITTSLHERLPEIAIHEIGHGFGLGDEYIDEAIANSYPSENVNRLPNISVTNDPNLVKWKHLINIPGHTESVNYRVGIFEGAYYRSKGFYRPSMSSIMNIFMSGHLYFNMPSREAIVIELHRRAGMLYKLDTFLKYDKLYKP